MLSRVTDGSFFNFSDATRNTNHHATNGRKPIGLHFANELPDQLLRNFKISNYAVLQWANRFDFSMGTLMHLLRFMTHRDHFPGCSI